MAAIAEDRKTNLRPPSRERHRRVPLAERIALLVLLCGCGAAGGVEATHGGSTATENLPGRLEFSLFDLWISKDGDRIFEGTQRTLFSTMPRPEDTPPEESETSRAPLAPETFAQVWERLRAFDFEPYARLRPEDFAEARAPEDATFSNRLRLVVDGATVVDVDLRGGVLTDESLQAGLTGLHEAIAQIVNAARIREALSRITVPQTLAFSFGRYSLAKSPDRILVAKLLDDPSETDPLWRDNPDLEALAAANPDRLEVGGGAIHVLLEEADFLDLWRELEQVDIVRFATLAPEDFVFREQEVTYSLYLSVDGLFQLALHDLDREIRPEVAAPLLRFTDLLEAEIRDKIDRLRRGEP